MGSEVIRELVKQPLIELGNVIGGHVGLEGNSIWGRGGLGGAVVASQGPIL